MTTTKTVQQIETERLAAEEFFSGAKITLDALRVENAAAVLREAFPSHDLAVFGRDWDHERPALIQLIGKADGGADIELDDDESVASLTNEQKRATLVADRLIRAIGDDEEVLRHLQGAEEHADWIEFNLPLNPATPESE